MENSEVVEMTSDFCQMPAPLIDFEVVVELLALEQSLQPISLYPMTYLGRLVVAHSALFLHRA